MSDHDVRGALARYAATTPDLDPREGLAARLARRERARRATVAGVACLAALVAGSGLAVLTRDGGDASIVAARDTPSPTPAPSGSPDPTPSPEPEPSAATTPPFEPSGPPRSPEPSSSSLPPPPSAQPGTPEERRAQGPHGLEVTATLRPGSFATATRVELTVSAVDDDGTPQIARVSWGDGTEEPVTVAMPMCEDDPARTVAPRSPAPGDIERRYAHSWRHPGRYTVTARVHSDAPCDERVPPEDVTVRFEIDVAPGRITSNGPYDVEIMDEEVAWNDDGDPYEFYAAASLVDLDGHIARMTIDWGDGSEPTVVRNERGCDDGDGDHYPFGNWTNFREVHRYQPGRYTVTITSSSAGCGGADVQRGEATVEVDVESVD